MKPSIVNSPPVCCVNMTARARLAKEHALKAYTKAMSRKQVPSSTGTDAGTNNCRSNHLQMRCTRAESPQRTLQHPSATTPKPREMLLCSLHIRTCNFFRSTLNQARNMTNTSASMWETVTHRTAHLVHGALI